MPPLGRLSGTGTRRRNWPNLLAFVLELFELFVRFLEPRVQLVSWSSPPTSQPQTHILVLSNMTTIAFIQL